jgi:hypothetical protein
MANGPLLQFKDSLPQSCLTGRFWNQIVGRRLVRWSHLSRISLGESNSCKFLLKSARQMVRWSSSKMLLAPSSLPQYVGQAAFEIELY